MTVERETTLEVTEKNRKKRREETAIQAIQVDRFMTRIQKIQRCVYTSADIQREERR